MSIKLMNAAWLLPPRPADRLVLLSLADNANDEGHCFPSELTIASKCSMCERSVRSAIARLVKGRHLTVQHRSGTRNAYLIHPMSRAMKAASAAPTRRGGGIHPGRIPMTLINHQTRKPLPVEPCKPLPPKSAARSASASTPSEDPIVGEVINMKQRRRWRSQKRNQRLRKAGHGGQMSSAKADKRSTRKAGRKLAAAADLDADPGSAPHPLWARSSPWTRCPCRRCTSR